MREIVPLIKCSKVNFRYDEGWKVPLRIFPLIIFLDVGYKYWCNCFPFVETMFLPPFFSLNIPMWASRWRKNFLIVALILQGDEIRTQPLHHPTAHSPPLLGQSIFTEQESAFAELHIEFSRIIYLKHFFYSDSIFPWF